MRKLFFVLILLPTLIFGQLASTAGQLAAGKEIVGHKHSSIQYFCPESVTCDTHDPSSCHFTKGADANWTLDTNVYYGKITTTIRIGLYKKTFAKAGEYPLCSYKLINTNDTWISARYNRKASILIPDITSNDWQIQKQINGEETTTNCDVANRDDVSKACPFFVIAN